MNLKNLHFIAALLLPFACPADDVLMQTTKVAKYNGAKQCESDHISLASMAQELIGNGIPVLSAACGRDNRLRPAVCGAEAGQLNIYVITTLDQEAAINLGFQPVASFPGARDVQCPSGESVIITPQKAIEVSINGIGPPVDAIAFEAVRQLFGKAVTRGVIDKFLVYGYGIEGGFSACAEASRFATASQFANLARRFRAIQPDPSTTAYSINLTSACTNPVIMPQGDN